MPGWYVVVLHPDGDLEARELTPGTCCIGRDPTSGLRLADAAVSRRHAVLDVAADRVWLTALPTRNGTSLNGRPVEGRVPLGADDQVLVGRTLLALRHGDVERERARQQPTADLTRVAVLRPSDRSPAMRALLERAERAARSDLPLLITGESGTGKEVLARYLHTCSPRAGGPFVALDCPALPATLVESELFGVEAGVATGVTAREGLLEQAAGGTLLLDEIGDLALETQAKLLRFLQDRTVLRVGARRPVTVDARVLAATNRPLDAAIASGAFRSDLYYRLAALTLDVPPLRARRDDILPLAEQFLPAGISLAEDAAARLMTYRFPGNVRELEAVVRRAAVLAGGAVIRAAELELGDEPAEPKAAPCGADLLASVRDGRADFWTAIHGPFIRRELPRSAVRDMIARGLAESGSVRALADLLRVGDRYRKLLDFVRNNELLPER